MHTIAAMKKILKDCGVKGYSGKTKAEIHAMCLKCPGGKGKMMAMMKKKSC